jgi:outer membrane protein TolC
MRAAIRSALLLAIALCAAPADAASAQGPGTAPAPALPPALTPAPPSPAPELPPVDAVDFDEAVRRASQRNTSAVVAAEEVRRAEALLEQARSGSLPLLAGTGTYTHLDKVRRSGPNTLAYQDQWNGTLSLTVPLVVPSRWYQWSHASDQVAVSRASRDDVRRIVTLTAARAYLSIVAQKRTIDVSRRAVRNAADHYDYAHTRRQGGVGNALDEARADQQLATAQVQLENAMTALIRAQEALGIATGADRPLDARAEPDLRFGAATEADAMKEAEANRADLKAARQRADAAHAVARDSYSDWLPSLSAQGSTWYQDPPSLTVPRDGWQVQGILSVPIYEGGLRLGQMREREALDREAQTQLAGTAQQARSDVRTAYGALQHAESAFEKARRAAERAATALSLVTQAYKAGATTSLDVSDAEQRARDADTAAVVAEDAVRQARLDLLAATGRFP